MIVIGLVCALVLIVTFACCAAAGRADDYEEAQLTRGFGDISKSQVDISPKK